MHTVEERLRSVGLRITKPRVAVLAELAGHPHADVETIASGVRERLGTVSTQAIYDVVHALTRAGLVRHVAPAGSRALFEIETGDNHHHMVCRNCSVIVDIPCATGEAPCLHVADDHDFHIDEAEVTFWGLCPGCQPASEETPNRMEKTQ